MNNILELFYQYYNFYLFLFVAIIGNIISSFLFGRYKKELNTTFIK